MKVLALLCLSLLLPACNALPRDPEGTEQAIRDQKRIRVGLVPGPQGLGRAASARLLGQLESRMQARAHIVSGATEPLLRALDQGDIDIVLSPFDAKTPWATLVALTPPIAASGEGEKRVEIRAAMRNGENRWIMTVETIARAAADPGASS